MNDSFSSISKQTKWAKIQNIEIIKNLPNITIKYSN